MGSEEMSFEKMNFEELIIQLVTETKMSSVPSWLDVDYITVDGNIDKNKLITALENWVRAESNASSKYHKVYLELITVIREDDEAWNSFIYYLSRIWIPVNPNDDEHFDWGLNIEDFWQIYGFAIKKAVGHKAKQIHYYDLQSYPFRDEIIVKTDEQKHALSDCVVGYSWDVSVYTKKTCPPLRDLLPKMKSKKARIRKKYVYKVMHNANKIIKSYTLLINGRNGAIRFNGGTKFVPEQFATYACVANYNFTEKESDKSEINRDDNSVKNVQTMRKKKEKYSYRHQHR